jgi:hypothetical protein
LNAPRRKQVLLDYTNAGRAAEVALGGPKACSPSIGCPTTAVLTPGRYAEIEVHNWQFGGRR